MLRASSSPAPQRGFTLLEVLVALAVFAVIGAIAWRGLDVLTATRARLDQEMHAWRELELVFERMGLDLTQLAPRYFTDNAGKRFGPIQVSSNDNGSICQLDVLRFSAASGRDPVHFRYRMSERTLRLVQLYDTPGQRAMASAPGGDADSAAMRESTLLENVNSCKIDVLNTDGSWTSKWPPEDPDDLTRPWGVRLRLNLEGRGYFERMYYLP